VTAEQDALEADVAELGVTEDIAVGDRRCDPEAEDAIGDRMYLQIDVGERGINRGKRILCRRTLHLCRHERPLWCRANGPDDTSTRILPNADFVDRHRHHPPMTMPQTVRTAALYDAIHVADHISSSTDVIRMVLTASEMQWIITPPGSLEADDHGICAASFAAALSRMLVLGVNVRLMPG
jgi:hypothetical protein